jgi:hypothetical protein
MDTWGTNLDLLIAFALGVLAHRTVQSLRSASEEFTSYLKGEEEKPATAEEKLATSAETPSTSTAPAKTGG